MYSGCTMAAVGMSVDAHLQCHTPVNFLLTNMHTGSTLGHKDITFAVHSQLAESKNTL